MTHPCFRKEDKGVSKALDLFPFILYDKLLLIANKFQTNYN